jgi:hypothetical protein
MCRGKSETSQKKSRSVGSGGIIYTDRPGIGGKMNSARRGKGRTAGRRQMKQGPPSVERRSPRDPPPTPGEERTKAGQGTAPQRKGANPESEFRWSQFHLRTQRGSDLRSTRSNTMQQARLEPRHWTVIRSLCLACFDSHAPTALCRSVLTRRQRRRCYSLLE